MSTALASSQMTVGETLFGGTNELSVDAFVGEVLARNPTLAQMTAAWQAASARYPQVSSLEDPIFGSIFGPASIGSNKVDFAYRLEAAQQLPWPGKLMLRGQNASAEAAAAGNELADTQLQLVESAKIAFSDYYLVYRAIAVNEESLQLLRDIRTSAEDRYRANQSPQQDLLQADVEIGRLRERSLALERMREVTQARMNILMHLLPDCPLPPPPQTLDVGDALPPVAELRTRAISHRPDLQAVANRIEAERASLALACKEYYPDFEAVAAYDAFWQPNERDLRPMVGVRLNVPVRRERRHAAVAEAQSRLAQKVAELQSRTDQVYLQVQESQAQVHESEKAIRLYDETILPAAIENVKAARTAYAIGRIPFLALIESQRNLIELRDRYYEAIAEYHRRRATLDRVVGTPLAQLQ